MSIVDPLLHGRRQGAKYSPAQMSPSIFQEAEAALSVNTVLIVHFRSPTFREFPRSLKIYQLDEGPLLPTR